MEITPRGRGSLKILLPALLAAAAGPAAARSEDDLSFHAADDSFRPADIPDWVHESTRVAFATGSQIDPAADAGVQVIHTGAGRAYYPLVKDDPASGFTPEEKKALRDAVARARARGLRIVCGVPPYAPPNLLRLHPGWLARSGEEPPAALPADLEHISPCLNGPWGDYYIDCLGEILEEYGLDGFSFDGNYLPALCRCRWCREQHRGRTGREIPGRADLESIDYRLYMLWAGDRLEDWYRRLRERLRRANPEAVLWSWTVNAGRWGHFLTSPRAMSLRMNLLLDCPMQEWWLDETNFGSSIVPAFGAAYIQAVSGHRVAACEPYLMSRGDPYGTDSFPRQEAMARAMLAITNGCICAFSFGWPGHARTAAEVMEAIRARGPWLARARPAPHAAILVGEQSRQFHGLDRIAERYLPHPLGVFRAACEEHIAAVLITEWDLRPESLSAYKVLVLPNAACLSDSQAAAVRAFVEAGGGLVATADTSLFDEIGRPRQDFALKDVLGVSYSGWEGDAAARRWRQRAGVASLRWSEEEAGGELLRDERLEELVPGRQVAFKGPWTPIGPPAAGRRAVVQMAPAGAEGTVPAAVAGEFGKGRVVYLAAGIDAAYYGSWYPYQRRILARAIDWAAREPFPIEVRAPMCVQAAYYKQMDADGERIIVHLFNDLRSSGGHGRPDIDVPLREEAVPVSGIELRLRGLRFRRIHLEPGASEPEIRAEGEVQVAILPPLPLHYLAVIELEGE